MRRVLTLLALVFALLSVPSPAFAGVNVNTASLSELETLPGIGPTKAAAIVAHREQFGPFKSLADLDNVPGIGPSTLASIQPMVEFGDGAAAPAAPPPTAVNPSATPSSVAAPPAAAPSASPAPALSPGSKININTASAAQLDQLPGIGPAKATAILESREQAGPFDSCESLSRVTGIGPATISLLLESCTVQ